MCVKCLSKFIPIFEIFFLVLFFYDTEIMIFRSRGQLTFTRPTRNDDLGNISFWPDASFLVCHGGDLFKINIHVCTSVSLL